MDGAPTVILITGDAPTSRLVRWALDEAGYSVDTVPDAASVLEQPTLYRGYDLIVFDGATTQAKRDDAFRIRALLPQVRMVSLHVHPDGAESSPHLIAEGHLHKPFQAEELVQCLESVLRLPVGARSAHLG